MKIQDINSLNLSELKDLLKQVKEFKDLKTKLWKRWVDLFNRNLEGKDLFIVEYFWDTNEDEVYTISKKVFIDIFNSDIEKSEINFVRNDEIKWWIKVYKNDSMVDLSFSKVEKLIK